jgi:isopenicillin N synthase-like dioxygenase
MHDDFSSLPIIDVASLAAGSAEKRQVAAQIDAACRQSGFFYVIGHGVDAGLQRDLQTVARQFFARPTAEKLRIEMSRGGKAWRGYFRVGDELTSGRPDQKEGLYFGQELAADHPLVQAGTPLHGANVFPEVPAGMRATILQYMAALTELGKRLMGGIALGLAQLPQSERKIVDFPAAAARKSLGRFAAVRRTAM